MQLVNPEGVEVEVRGAGWGRGNRSSAHSRRLALQHMPARMHQRRCWEGLTRSVHFCLPSVCVCASHAGC